MSHTLPTAHNTHRRGKYRYVQLGLQFDWLRFGGFATFNSPQFFLFGRIRSSQTGDQSVQQVLKVGKQVFFV